MKPCRPAAVVRAARSGRAVLAATACWLVLAAHAQAVPDLSALPRPDTPPPERGPVVPAQVERWRLEAKGHEYGDGVPRDALLAAQLYCRAARYGDAESQFNLAWMLTNARGIERDEAQAAHLFAAAAEQGLPQALNMASHLGAPLGPPPPCLRPPEQDPLTATARPQPRAGAVRSPSALFAALPPPANAPQPIVRFVDLVAPEYKLAPQLVLAVMATESGFDPGALSPKNAQGLMQLMPDTAARFKVRKLSDPVQNIRGGMAYLRWLLAYYQGDVLFTLAAYNAGEGAVDRYRGVPPYAETRAYVRRILAALGGQRWHPYDPEAAAPSPMLSTLSAAAASPPTRLR
ncbi:lytic transglycosylase domain-containing protein [Rubrivivax benzoatilyticus]|uniref:Transglycosylase SLT domain-containing protein n=1 Tax=Rubrivivax benzoatilyticus TaxID=316997 RepID=A0ABX0HTX0_9BURK|nr:lytic transglycosylase domain-containing protein [Rubrivivax benzoatilyticus]EGJ10340.1 lytic transglycosylase catalytic [Rubrivivax benzoatilyticus JA2 = ATCC BAA-35]NHK98467.1 transglycosylase SLT domain-containing protein [Rubrivivax benzoatilyticus]NHL23758.1 transglycosylase SLT domain-containing protein [Rubrivivax benzoatilyticus]